MSKTIEEQVEDLLDIFTNDNIEEDGTMYARTKQPTDMLKGRLMKDYTQALQQRDQIAREEERNRLRKNLGQAFVEYSNGEGKLRPFSWADFIEEVVTSNYYD